MKRVINGKRYDTETAEKICDFGSDGNTSRSDFNWHDSALYRTKMGPGFSLARAARGVCGHSL